MTAKKKMTEAQAWGYLAIVDGMAVCLDSLQQHTKLVIRSSSAREEQAKALLEEDFTRPCMTLLAGNSTGEHS